MVLRASLLVLIIGVIVIFSFHQDAFAAEQTSSSSSGQATSSSPDQKTGNPSGQLVGNEPQISGTRKITIDTVPRVGNVVVDEMLYLSSELPLRFDWKVNSRHTIEISDTTVKNGADSRYVFDIWNDQSKAVIKTINVKSDMNVRAIFKVQNHLKINSDVGTIQGGGWYNEGEMAQFSIVDKNIIADGNEHRYIFDGWSDGESKKSLKNSVIVDKPLTINANWKEQYYLDLTSSVSGANMVGGGWFDKGQKAPLITDKEFQSSSDVKYVFNRWVTTGNNPTIIDNPDSNIASLTISGAHTIMADWKKFNYLNVISLYGTTQGSGFYEEGSSADISLSINEFTILENKRKAVFDRWSGADNLNLPSGSGSVKSQLGSVPESLSSSSRSVNLQYGGVSQSLPNAQSGQLSSPNTQVKVDKPMTLVAKWKDQYYLDVTSKQGTASGSGWYNAGQTANIEVTQPSAPPGVWMRYIFSEWGGDFQSDFIKAKVIMTEPKTIKAQWREDYSPAIMNSLIMSGVGAVGLFIYRKTKKHENGIMINKENGMKESKTNWMAMLQGIYDYKRNKGRLNSRSNFSTMDYQYALFEPRIPRFL